MTKPYKLSICMMVKDEEQNLDRCLQGLKAILAASDVELIIVDTGSTDATVEIAKHYTKNIYFHPWNNDFSTMRNQTIAYAKGEWILILDADEVLTDAVALFSLLKSPKVTQANTIQLKMRDFVKSSDPNVFVYYTSYRVFKNDGKFRYDGAVHNQPVFKGPILNVPIIIDHYGYQFDNKDLLEKKFKRTSEILIRELDKDPNNIYYRFQLANSYYIHEDLREALEQIRIGYRLLSKKPLQQRDQHAYVYAEYGRESFANREFQECVTVCLEGIDIRADYIDLYFYASVSYQALGREREAYDYALKYLELVGKYDELSITKDAAIIMMCTDTASTQTINAIVAQHYYRLGEWEKALAHTDNMNESFSTRQLQFNICFDMKDFRKLSQIYYETSNLQERENLISVLEQKRDSLNPLEKTSLSQKFSSGNDEYSLLNKLRSASGNLAETLTKAYILSTDFNKKDEFYADVLRCFKRDLKEIITSFKRTKGYKIKHFIHYLIRHYTAIEEEVLFYLLNENVRPTDYESNRIYASIAQVLLLNEAETAKEANRDIKEVYISLFGAYLEKSINRLALIYRLEKMRLYLHTLDEVEDQFILTLYFAKEYSKKGSYQSAIKLVKEAVEIYPYFGSYVAKSQDYIFQELSPQ